MQQGHTGSESNMSAGSIGGSSDREHDSASGYISTPERVAEKTEGRKGRKRKGSSGTFEVSINLYMNL